MKIGSRVTVKMVGADATFDEKEAAIAAAHGEDGMHFIKEVYDVGVAIVVNIRPEACLGGTLYQLAIVEGRFDSHRDDLEQLWVTEDVIEVTA